MSPGTPGSRTHPEQRVPEVTPGFLSRPELRVPGVPGDSGNLEFRVTPVTWSSD